MVNIVMSKAAGIIMITLPAQTMDVLGIHMDIAAKQAAGTILILKVVKV